MEKDTLRMQFLSGVLTEGQYKTKLQENKKKKSLNESMIGGIVGIGAINQIPPRAKADYETAFEHFLGEKYGLNEVEIEEVKIEEGKEEVVLSNELLNFLEERGVINADDAQKIHKDLTSFLEDKIKPEKSSQEKNYDPQYSQDPRERYDSGGSQPGH